MALPIVVSARYLSRRFVWETYVMVICLTVLTTIPHAAFGLPIASIILSRLCRDGRDALSYQAKIDARLADVEKGLAIAATMEFMREDKTGPWSRAIQRRQ